MDLFGFPALKNGINMNFFFSLSFQICKVYTVCFYWWALSLSLSLSHTHVCAYSHTDRHRHMYCKFAHTFTLMTILCCWLLVYFFWYLFFFFLFVYCPFIDWLFNLAVPPAYYAHLAAFRARFYMEPETSDSGSMTSGAAAGRGMGGAGPRSTRPPGANAAVRPLPALKENVKRVMFYC